MTEGKIVDAAIETVNLFLGGFDNSGDMEDLWENHPFLEEEEARDAGTLAISMVHLLTELFVGIGREAAK